MELRLAFVSITIQKTYIIYISQASFFRAVPVLNCAHELPLPALNSSSKLDASFVRGKTHSLESLVESLLFSNAVAQGSNARRSILVYAVLTQHAAQDPAILYCNTVEPPTRDPPR